MNFIKNFSDEVIRQNHHLKGQIISLKKSLTNYQFQIVEELKNAGVETLLESPSQSLRQLVKLFRKYQRLHQQSEKKLLQKHEESSRLQKQRQEYKLKLNQKMNETTSLRKNLIQISEKLSMTQQQSAISLQLAEHAKSGLQVQLKQSRQSMRQTQLQLEQTMKNSVQQVRIHHHKQLLEYRTRVQNDQMKSEAILRSEIAKKDGLIKQMSKSVEKIAKGINFEETDISVLKNIFLMIQGISDNNESITHLQQKNAVLRQAFTKEKNNCTGLQQNILQLKNERNNLINKIQRINSEKIQLDHQLLQKIKLLQKQDKQKQKMEAYYDQKWSSEFKKVQRELEKKMQAKIQEKLRQVETQKIKLLILQEDCKNSNNRLLLQKQEVQKVAQATTKEMKSLQQQYSILVLENEELKRSANETAEMGYQQLLMVRFNHALETKQLMVETESKEKEIFGLNKQLVDGELLFNSKIEEIQLKTKEILSIGDLSLAKIKDQLEREHGLQIREINKQIEQSNATFEREIQILKQKKIAQIRLKQEELQKRLSEKDSQCSRKLEQLRNKMRFNEQKHKEFILKIQSDLDFERRRCSKLQKQAEIHRSEDEDFKRNSHQIQLFKDQSRVINANLGKQIDLLAYKLRQAQHSVKEFSRQNKELEQQKEDLKKQKSTWNLQIKQIEKLFLQQLKELKKHQQKHLFFYKSRIWELESIAKRKYIQQKDIDKIQVLIEDKKKLEDSMHVKQAENIILKEVKDYYEHKLRQTENKFVRNEGVHVLARKPKREQFYTNLETDRKVFESEQIKQITKNIRSSSKKSTMKTLTNSFQRNRLKSSLT